MINLILHYFVYNHFQNSNLDSPVEGCGGEGVVVLGVDDNLHHVVGVSLKHLCTRPFLVPVPQFDQHVI